MRLLLVLAFSGVTLAGGLAEMKQLSGAGKPDDALAAADKILAPGKFAKWREEATARPGWKRTLVEAADPLFAAVGLSDLSPAERAAVHYARGVVLANAEKRGEAGEAFEKARALAGPGDLRLDATYDLAWTALEEGEIQRKQIPELGGTPPAAAMPPTPGGPQASGAAPPAPDALQLAKAAYLLARDRFVERLKADAGDPDSRANVELAQKRLRELAEIEKKREEEKKKQQDQQKKDQDQKDKDKNDQDSKDKQDQKNQDDAKDPKKDDKSEDQKKKDEQQQKDEQQKQDQDKKKDAKPDSSKEQQLTKEEVMRLLDTLKDREEEGKRLLEMRKRANRARVKKDW